MATSGWTSLGSGRRPPGTADKKDSSSEPLFCLSPLDQPLGIPLSHPLGIPFDQPDSVVEARVVGQRRHWRVPAGRPFRPVVADVFGLVIAEERHPSKQFLGRRQLCAHSSETRQKCLGKRGITWLAHLYLEKGVRIFWRIA